ncbi:MAG: hypothetical protein HZB87_07435 [Desulfatitalea sp.]|nr:hypothetical protein [Desulfatitalea sp.]MBI5896811.1 hypothetical protein [Desulfobacterales bacterium]
MPRSFALIVSVLAVILFSACAEVQNVRIEPRQGFSEAPVVDGNYWKKGAIALKAGAQNDFGRQSEQLLLQTLIETIDRQADRLRLLPPDDNQSPDFMKLANPFADPQSAFEFHKKARMQGFHCLLQTSVLDIRPVEKKKGIWWFRGIKYYLNVVVSLDLYDTFTAAKISSQVMEALVKINSAAYEDYQAGIPNNIEAVDEAIVDMAQEMGELAAEQIDAGRWMAVVAAVQERQVRLAAGSDAGLEEGDRLAVFEGQRIADGLNGEKFIVPGYKLADIEIVAVEANSATAQSEVPAVIRPGDIAIPAE